MNSKLLNPVYLGYGENDKSAVVHARWKSQSFLFLSHTYDSGLLYLKKFCHMLLSCMHGLGIESQLRRNRTTFTKLLWNCGYLQSTLLPVCISVMAMDPTSASRKVQNIKYKFFKGVKIEVANLEHFLSVLPLHCWFFPPVRSAKGLVFLISVAVDMPVWRQTIMTN